MLTEDHTEYIGAEETAMTEESTEINDESNMLLPSTMITTEDTLKAQEKCLKEHFSARGLAASSEKSILLKRLSQASNDNTSNQK